MMPSRTPKALNPISGNCDGDVPELAGGAAKPHWEAGQYRNRRL